jgi:hypothetical protein
MLYTRFSELDGDRATGVDRFHREVGEDRVGIDACRPALAPTAVGRLADGEATGFHCEATEPTERFIASLLLVVETMRQ